MSDLTKILHGVARALTVPHDVQQVVNQIDPDAKQQINEGINALVGPLLAQLLPDAALQSGIMQAVQIGLSHVGLGADAAPASAPARPGK